MFKSNLIKENYETNLVEKITNLKSDTFLKEINLAAALHLIHTSYTRY